MSAQKSIVNHIMKFLFGLKESQSFELSSPKRILLVRQHNQLGDLLASTPILTAIKENFPDVYLTVITGPQNFKAYKNNPFIDKNFVFDKRKLFDRRYFKELTEVLKGKYDVAFVPAVTSISFTSNFLARLSNSDIKVGVRSLNGKVNSSQYLFNRLVTHDWRNKENVHITDRNLALLEPFGIFAINKKIIIHSDNNDKHLAEDFIKTLRVDGNGPIIGMHVGAGKIQNRWSYLNFAELIDKLIIENNARIYLTEGGSGDASLIKSIKGKISGDIKIFDKKGMGLLKELISYSDLFITNDTGPMHTAASTDTPVISLFGSTNPFMWAPLGENKKFIWKGNNINDISVDDVYENVVKLLDKL